MWDKQQVGFRHAHMHALVEARNVGGIVSRVLLLQHARIGQRQLLMEASAAQRCNRTTKFHEFHEQQQQMLARISVNVMGGMHLQGLLLQQHALIGSNQRT